MKYTREERLEIGRRIYQGEITLAAAATHYNIDYYTVRAYLRLYKASINVSIPREISGHGDDGTLVQNPSASQYESMTRDELMDELIRSKVNEARAKKGYEVKGVGRNKIFSPINNKNSKL